MRPREFCQQQLLLLGDEELQPEAYAVSLEILHRTIMDDLDPAAFEGALRALAAWSTPADGRPSVAARVAGVLLDAWLDRDDA